MKFYSFSLLSLLLTLTVIDVPHICAQEKNESQTKTTAPNISLPNKTKKIGKILAGQSVKHSFSITNKGTEKLKINKVELSCGCATTGFDREILPGERGKITIVLNTLGLHGKKHETATVYTNDPVNPKIKLHLDFTVWSEIKVSPEFVIFHPGKITHDKKIIQITNQTKKPLIISNLKCVDKKFKTKLREIKKGELYELIIITDPSKLDGTEQSVLTFDTTCKNTPNITIPILAISAPQPSKEDE